MGSRSVAGRADGGQRPIQAGGGEKVGGLGGRALKEQRRPKVSRSVAGSDENGKPGHVDGGDLGQIHDETVRMAGDGVDKCPSQLGKGSKVNVTLESDDAVGDT